jgi:hypothetical protein
MACKRSAVRSRLAPPSFAIAMLPPRPHRLVVRTPPFHGGNRGSNPLGDAIFNRGLRFLPRPLFIFSGTSGKSSTARPRALY